MDLMDRDDENFLYDRSSVYDNSNSFSTITKKNETII